MANRPAGQPGRFAPDFPHVLPLQRVAFAVAQAMVKTTVLESAGVRVDFREAVFPESNPALSREFQITRRAEHMEVIGHEKKIAHQPRRSAVFPDAVQRSVNGRLRQPTLALLSAHRKEDPVRTTQENVYSLRGRASARFVKWCGGHRLIFAGKPA